MNKLHITAVEQVDRYATQPDDQIVPVALGLLRKLLRKAEPGTGWATDEEIDQAWHRHCIGADDEIEIGQLARVRRGEDGPWVEAWLFVPKECIDGYKPGVADDAT